MTQVFPTVSLGSLVKIVRGISYKSSELSDSGLGVPMVNLRNVGKGGGFRADGLKHFTGSYKDAQVLKSGDLILANTDLSKAKDVLGSTFLIPETVSGAVLSLDLSKLVPDETLIDKRFLNYYLQSPSAREYMKANGQGITVMHLRMAALPNLRVPLPPLEEQKRIVETLDSQLSRLEVVAEDLSQIRVKTIHLLMSSLEDAISDCESLSRQPLKGFLENLGSRTNVQRGWSPQCLPHPQSDPENWAVLKTTAVQNMSYESQHNKELPKTLTPKTNLEVRSGDFLMTTTGPRNRCGVVCYVRETPAKLIFSGKILRFRPNQDVLHPEWLESVLASPTYQTLLNDLKVGSSDSSVSIGNAQILDLAVPVPTMPKQIELVERIRKMKDISNSFEVQIIRTIERLGVLRRSILHSAFSGQLGKEN